MKTIEQKLRISQYLENNSFKKDFPDIVQPDFFWFVKDIHHKYFKDLNINVNIEEERITVFVDEVSDITGRGGDGQVCIMNQSFKKLDEHDTCLLIGHILFILKQ